MCLQKYMRYCRMVVKLTPQKLSVCLLISILLIWGSLQLFIFMSCKASNHNVPTLENELCQKDQQKFLLLEMLEKTEVNDQCPELIRSIKKALLAYDDTPIIFVVTPTYERPVQKAELTRLSHTLMLVPNVHWIVVEDADNKTSLVKNFLSKLRIQYAHLNVPTPLPIKMRKEDPSWLKPKGVLQRNLALTWLRHHIDPSTKGVVYFADDDNTYDLRLFEEMRYTKRVSVWPVGLAGGLMVERPLVTDGKVTGWNTVWKADRPFPIDMAGFAVNLALLFKHLEAGFSLSVPRGYQESRLLKDLVTLDELEPRANYCTKVLVWHTRTEYPKLKMERKLSAPSNLNIEV